MPTIEVNHITKEYRLGQMTSLKQSFLRNIDRLRGRKTPKQEPFKAFDDINFKMEEGEVLGIIGSNGAGKSTLLKLLARVSTPTKGEIKVRGSVAPLIEVGASLHPELTGRENIYLNGSILGLPRAVIKEKFDEIVEFAELEEFIDTPIKHYTLIRILNANNGNKARFMNRYMIIYYKGIRVSVYKYPKRLLQKSQFCHSRSDSERESGSNCLKNHIRPRMLVSGIETFGDDK